MRTLQIQTLQQRGPFRSLTDNLGRSWGRIVKAAGVDDLSIHDLRRTFITRLVNEGVPMKTIMELAGHTCMATTLRYYTKVTDADKRAAILKIHRLAGA